MCLTPGWKTVGLNTDELMICGNSTAFSEVHNDVVFQSWKNTANPGCLLGTECYSGTAIEIIQQLESCLL